MVEARGGAARGGAAGRRCQVSGAVRRGGCTTAHYGAMEGVDAIQIEMCQRLYMEEGHPDGAPDGPAFDAARQRLRRALGAVVKQLR